MWNHYFSLPCVRGGVRRGMSLTERLLCTRSTDFYNPPASRSLGTLPYTGRAEKKHFSPLTQGGQEGKRFLALKRAPEMWNKNKESTCGFPRRCFPAIGLSINQTVVSKFYLTSIQEDRS